LKAACTRTTKDFPAGDFPHYRCACSPFERNLKLLVLKNTLNTTIGVGETKSTIQEIGMHDPQNSFKRHPSQASNFAPFFFK